MQFNVQISDVKYVVNVRHRGALVEIDLYQDGHRLGSIKTSDRAGADRALRSIADALEPQVLGSDELGEDLLFDERSAL